MTPSNVIVSKRLVAVNSVSFAVVRLLHATAFLWVQHHLLQRVSPEEYSVFALIGSLFFLMPVLTLVFTSSASRYIVDNYAAGRFDRVTTVVSSMFPILLLVGGIIMMAAVLGARHIATLFVIPPGCKRDAQWMLVLLAAAIVADLVLTPFAIGPNVLQKYIVHNAIGLAGETLKIVLLFVLLFGVSTRALWVVVAGTAAELFTLGARIVVSRGFVPYLRFSLRRIEPSIIPQLFSYGTWNAIGSLGNYIRNHAVVLVLNRFSTPIDVTCFSLGRAMNRQASHLWEPIRASLSPPLIAMHVTGRSDALRRAYCTGGRYALWLVMAAVTPLMVLRHEFVALYAGPQYHMAGNILLLVLLPIPFEMVSIMVTQIAQAKAQLKGLALRRFFINSSILVTILVAAWRYHAGGLEAAMIFAAFGIAGELFLIWPHAAGLVGVENTDLLRQTIVPGLVPIVFGVFVLTAIRHVFVLDTWDKLAGAALIGAIAYLSGALLVFRAEDRRGLVGLFRKGLVRA